MEVIRHIVQQQYDSKRDSLDLPEPEDGKTYPTVCGTPRFVTYSAVKKDDDVYCGECVRISLKEYKRTVQELEITRTTISQMMAAASGGSEVLKLYRKLWTAEDK